LSCIHKTFPLFQDILLFCHEKPLTTIALKHQFCLLSPVSHETFTNVFCTSSSIFYLFSLLNYFQF
jgi:hypothetical protein